jgi:hypothetical protein
MQMRDILFLFHVSLMWGDLVQGSSWDSVGDVICYINGFLPEVGREIGFE